MQLGMIGLGRMGANMVRRLIRNGHSCVVFDRSPEAVHELVADRAVAAVSFADFVSKLQKPRTIWLMVPAAAVDQTIADLLPQLEPGDILIDRGNSHYLDDIRRAKDLAPSKIQYVDVGTSGGVWRLERGYCMMIGGEKTTVEHLQPILSSLAPGIGNTPRTPNRESLDGTAEFGYLRCGPYGAGHFVKWSTTESSTESWRRMRKDCQCCARQTLGRGRKVLMPRQRPSVIPNITNTTWISRTLPNFGGAAVSSRRGSWISRQQR